MKINLVGNRNGHAVVLWPSAVFMVLLVMFVSELSVAAFCLVVGWFSPMCLTCLPVAAGIHMGWRIKEALALPCEELPVVDTERETGT